MFKQSFSAENVLNQSLPSQETTPWVFVRNELSPILVQSSKKVYGHKVSISDFNLLSQNVLKNQILWGILKETKKVPEGKLTCLSSHLS